MGEMLTADTSDLSDPEGVEKRFRPPVSPGAGEIGGKNAGEKRLGPAQSGIKLAICRAFEGSSLRYDGGRWDWPPSPKPDRRGGARPGGKMGSDPGPALGERLG